VHDHSWYWIASASIVISTMLPTTTPPLSKVLFQLTPKSWQLIVALAVKPALAFGPFPETMMSRAAAEPAATSKNDLPLGS
jgi:hypothetical protein